MITGLIIATLLAVMAKPVDVEKRWTEARAAFDGYRFDQAVAMIDSYTAHARHKTANDSVCAALRQRAVQAAEMMETVEEITVLDSVKTLKSRLLDHYGISNETGTLRHLEHGGVIFTTGRGDRSIVAEPVDGNFDLFVAYTNGERHWLPDNVNTAANENYPFELTDGATLYFASDRHGSIGGYDLFVTRYNNETQTYSEPMHVGMPFNSIYNEYMMVIDELSHVGWFATDRYQTGDTVVIYKFRVPDTKTILPAGIDTAVRIATAQMRRYRVGYDERQGGVAAGNDKRDIQTFRFVVNDTLIYTSESQFRDSLSLVRYRELKELEDAVTLQSVILEGKKRDYQTTDDAADRAALREEILEDEEFLAESRRRITLLTREIRKLENMKII